MGSMLRYLKIVLGHQETSNSSDGKGHHVIRIFQSKRVPWEQKSSRVHLSHTRLMAQDGITVPANCFGQFLRVLQGYRCPAGLPRVHTHTHTLTSRPQVLFCYQSSSCPHTTQALALRRTTFRLTTVK